MSSEPTLRADRGPVARVVRQLEAVPLRIRLVAIVGTLVGAALVLTSLATAFLMRSDLMDGVDAELQSVVRPVASQALADLSSRDSAFPSNYAFELQSQFGVVTRLPTGVTADARPARAVDDLRRWSSAGSRSRSARSRARSSGASSPGG